jgi:hypothetical protein
VENFVTQTKRTPEEQEEALTQRRQATRQGQMETTNMSIGKFAAGASITSPVSSEKPTLPKLETSDKFELRVGETAEERLAKVKISLAILDQQRGILIEEMTRLTAVPAETKTDASDTRQTRCQLAEFTDRAIQTGTDVDRE